MLKQATFLFFTNGKCFLLNFIGLSQRNILIINIESKRSQKWKDHRTSRYFLFSRTSEGCFLKIKSAVNTYFTKLDISLEKTELFLISFWIMIFVLHYEERWFWLFS